MVMQSRLFVLAPALTFALVSLGACVTGAVPASSSGEATAEGAASEPAGGKQSAVNQADLPPIARSCEGGAFDDAEDGDAQTLKNGGRGGYWYTYADSNGTTIEPAGGFKMSPGGAEGSSYAIRMKGKTGASGDVYAGIGAAFVEPKRGYDASRYKAVAFYAKASNDSTAVRVKIPDGNTSPDGKKCKECYNDFGMAVSLTEEWTRYVVPFAAMKQEDGWGDPQPQSLATDEVYELQWQVAAKGVEYDIWIDNIELTGCE